MEARLICNNSLSNFADDLNVHENPKVSKCSTFNIIADDSSSLDNNFQKLNGAEQPFISKSSNSNSLSISTSVNLFPQILLFLVVKLNIV